MHKMMTNYPNGIVLFVPFVTFNQVQHSSLSICDVQGTILNDSGAQRISKMGLVRSAALHISRGINHLKLCNSVALDLPSVLQIDVSPATNVRQN